MKLILCIILMMTSIVSRSQEYPKIELNKRGEKVVVFTLSQAQKIDNDLEILNLLEKSKIQCDSLSISHIETIEAQNRRISLFEKSISELDMQIKDKDLQMENLSDRFRNLEKNNKICDDQKILKDRQIKLLKRDLRKEKIKTWLFGSSGLIVGVLAIIIMR